MHRLIFFCFSVSVIFSGCYSFKGIAIPPDIKTYYVNDFQFGSNVLSAPADLNQRFSEAIRAKIRNESRLIYNENEPDIEFSGSIIQFTLNPEAPQAGNTVALNKFEIGVNVDFTNHKDEKKNWKKGFTFFRTFDSTQDFLSLQDNLVKEIFDQLTENIFNEAFTGW
ncbi:MAG: hypothetical protein IPM42_01705 [Saprospiraceae bacterium]|nr:hypothetical protein [Saprospiraceae bacterium]